MMKRGFCAHAEEFLTTSGPKSIFTLSLYYLALYRIASCKLLG